MPKNRGRIRSAVLSLGLVLSISWPGTSPAAGPFGEESLPSGERRVEVTAQRISREVERKTTVAEGAVDILSGTLHLKADRVELNDDTMDITATGNVVVEFGKDRLQGELVKFNLRTEEGYVVNGQGFAQAYYFTGERIEKVSAERYHVLHGSFTSCEGVLPDWSFHSTDATIDVNDYIYSWNPTLWVKMVPVFYLPYAVVPIKRDRATGLLVPRIRFHKSDGLILSESFFWAPVDNADATVSLDYYSRRGWRPGLEMNYVLDQETSGSLKGSFIDDRLLNGRQWDLQFTHRHALPWKVNALAKIDYTNNEQYFRDFGETLEDQSQERLDSYASFTREWTGATVTLSAEHLRSLVSEQKSTFDRLPELNLRRVEGRVGQSPIFLALRLQGVGLREKTGGVEEETFRVDLAPRVSWPVNIQSWATVKPSAEVEYTYYTKNTRGKADDRFLYNPRVELTGPKFYRIFGHQSQDSRFKHIVTPKLTYNYLPDVDQKDLPKFDSLDRIASSNTLTYGLTNQVLGKFRAEEEGGRPVVREVFWLDLSQNYYLSPITSGAVTTYLGDLRGNLRFSPLTGLTLEASAAYDVKDGTLNEDNYRFSWNMEKVGSLSLERRHSRPSGVDYLEGSVTALPGPFELAYRGRYDLEDTAFVENSVEVKYTAQCWDVTLTYVKHEDDYEYKFLLNFKEIGTIIQF